MGLISGRAAVAAASAIGLAFVAGCASVAVSDDALQQRTSVALRVPASDVKISGRRDEGMQTNYLATASGRQYSCYVTGGVGVTGKTVSDAMCSETSKAAAGTMPATGAGQPACNALLKAAGKCQ